MGKRSAQLLSLDQDKCAGSVGSDFHHQNGRETAQNCHRDELITRHGERMHAVWPVKMLSRGLLAVLTHY